MKALLAFEASSRLGSFAAGAEELGVTPSAVSHQIQQLEEFLGVKLFNRRAGRAVLTPAGHTYTREISSAFSLILNATAVVAPQSQPGHLVIASSPSFAAKWLQPRLAGFLEANPAIKVRVSTLSGHEELSKDRCDIAIVFGRPSAGVGEVEPLVVERLRPLCSPLLVEQLGLRTPDDMSRATLIHSVNALSWAEYLRRIGKPELGHAHDLWLDRSTMAIEAAVAGLGLILESELLTQQELRDGRLVAPFGESAFAVESESYFLVRPAGFRNGNHVARFERWLRGRISEDGALSTGVCEAPRASASTSKE
jgi:LysR family transcriptional regulator, glycine cleavage system transcriptional activator